MQIRIPAEWEPHDCCWMAWAIHREWGKTANRVKHELSAVVRTIALYEPVRLLSPRGLQAREARREFADCKDVTVHEAPVDDIWMRDIAPTFAMRRSSSDQAVVAIDWNFNGWGRSRRFRKGDRLARSAVFGVPRLRAGFVAEGGALTSNGQGILVTTRSCLLNPRRNPGRPGEDLQSNIDAKFRRYGVRQVVWLEGDPCEGGTSGHVDGYVLLGPNGVALVDAGHDNDVQAPMWRAHDFAILKRTKTTKGKLLKVRQIRPPRPRYCKGDPDFFAASYLNAYIANGAVICARFGDPVRDEAARKALSWAFPRREIITMRIDNIAEGGGGIHCLTQPMPSIVKTLTPYFGRNAW
jgi:agmatine deiminase